MLRNARDELPSPAPVVPAPVVHTLTGIPEHHPHYGLFRVLREALQRIEDEKQQQHDEIAALRQEVAQLRGQKTKTEGDYEELCQVLTEWENGLRVPVKAAQPLTKGGCNAASNPIYVYPFNDPKILFMQSKSEKN